MSERLGLVRIKEREKDFMTAKDREELREREREELKERERERER